MRNRMGGFTLIELISTLVLVGVLSTISAFFLGSLLSGYSTIKNNSSAALKAQMALNRISLELKDMSALSSITNNSSLTYKDPLGNNRTIKFMGSGIYLSTTADNLLIDSVSNFTLRTVDNNGNSVVANEVVYNIDIGFTVNNVSGFGTRIFPRNRIPHP